MKTSFSPIVIIFLFSYTLQINAQFNVLEKVKKKVNKTIEKNIDEQIDKTVDGTEMEVKEGPSDESNNIENSSEKSINENENSEEENKQNIRVWRKYDFIPGDKIIFSDNIESEQVGEFPSKWNLLYGNAETVLFGETKAIGLVQNRTKVIPYMDKADFLPEVFTIEFDFYYYGKYNEAYTVHFDKYGFEIDIRPYKVSMKNFIGEPGEGAKDIGWHHFSISFNKRALKAYYDQTRVLNIPRLEIKPTSFSISALSHGASKNDPAIIKNIRVAEGGVKLYDRVLSEGKFVTRGILFDINKATIKPESMGVLNDIFALLNEHTDLKFSIEGHTDSDGEDSHNQSLSEERAESVKTALVDMGINKERLTTKGLGESTPIDNNSTQEGKANNRRVEFIKI
jgi:outer membrane protein OmpA-like peptidoglycan-associated protein